MKRFVSLFLCMVMVFCCSVPVFATQDDDIRVVMVDYYNAENEHVSKKEIKFDVKPVIINERTMVPVRFIAEELGYEVSYNPSNDTYMHENPMPVVTLKKSFSTTKNLRSSYPMYDLLVKNFCNWAENSNPKYPYIYMLNLKGDFEKYDFCTFGKDNIPSNILGDYLNEVKKVNITANIPVSNKVKEVSVSFVGRGGNNPDNQIVGCLSVPCDVPTQIIDDRTLIPLRALSESLGLRVEWDGNSRTVFIYGN